MVFLLDFLCYNGFRGVRMAKYEKGKIVRGTVTCIEPYGAFVSFGEFYNGLIHISEISTGFVRNISDFVRVGDRIYTEILEVDDVEAHLKLSIKNIQYRMNGKPRKRRIIETPSGFQTLEKNLPIWMSKKLKSIKNASNSIDK